MNGRAYEPNASRLVRRATPVYSVDDIRRNIARARAYDEPCVLEMAADIVLDRNVAIPSALRSFSIDGGGRYRFIVNFSTTTLFFCGASPTSFAALEIVTNRGCTITNVFRAEGSPLLLGNVVVDASDGVITNIFTQADAGTANELVVETAEFRGISHLFAAPNATGTWSHSRLSDIVVVGVGGALVTLGQGSTSPGFDFCVFERIRGPLSINPGPLSADTIFSHVEGDASTATIDTTNSSNPMTFIGLRNFVSLSLTRADVVLGSLNDAGVGIVNRLNTGIATASSPRTLNSAGPTLLVGPTSFLRVTHGASASGNVTVDDGVDGQILRLLFVAVAGSAVYTDGAGNLSLDSTFTPAVGDVLTLIYDEATTTWYEVSRSVVGGGGGGGGSSTFTEVTVDVGNGFSGSFDITGSGLTAGKPVHVWQAASPITSKGDARDEGEMDSITCTAYVVDSTTIRVYWHASGLVSGDYNFLYLVGA